MEMAIFRLPLKKDYIVLDEALDKSKSTTALACSTENPNILVLLLKAAEKIRHLSVAIVFRWINCR
jgi:hypothetical protein